MQLCLDKVTLMCINKAVSSPLTCLRYFVQLRNDGEEQPLCRFMFAVFIHSQKSSSTSDKYYDIYTFSQICLLVRIWWVLQSSLSVHSCHIKKNNQNALVRRNAWRRHVFIPFTITVKWAMSKHTRQNEVSKWTKSPGTSKLINWQIDRADD